MIRMTVPAKIEYLDQVLQFVEQELEKIDCPMKIQTQIAIATEEIFVNIAHYAYKPAEGDMTIECDITEDPLQVSLEFQDKGKPFDPLKKPDPDIMQSAEDREIGGLGIYMVKKSMDMVDYAYKDGMNILTIKKNVEHK